MEVIVLLRTALKKVDHKIKAVTQQQYERVVWHSEGDTDSVCGTEGGGGWKHQPSAVGLARPPASAAAATSSSSP